MSASRTRSATAAILVAGVGVVAAALAPLGALPAAATFPGTNGPIAYNLRPGGVHQINRLDPDGTGDALLIDAPGDEISPRWSPDGTRITYYRYIDGTGYRVFVANADGSGEVQVTSGPGDNDQAPSWSPDGTKLVYTSVRGGPGTGLDLWIIESDGSNPVQLTTGPDNDFTPAWSPDGTRVAFVRAGDPRTLRVVDVDGSNDLAVGDPDPHVEDPDWLPDGSGILFDSDRTGGGAIREIWRIDPDGSNPTRLSPVDGRSRLGPVASPDGTKLLFVRRELPEDGNGYGLWVSAADGTGEVLLLALPAAALGPDWAPGPAAPATTTTTSTAPTAPSAQAAVVAPRFTG